MMDLYPAVTEWQEGLGGFSESVAKNLKYLHVFGSVDEDTMGALMITEGDVVYGIGFNGDWGLLGDPNQGETIFPEARIHALSWNSVVHISVGATVGAAITEGGRMFHWGRDVTAEWSCAQALGVHQPSGSYAHNFTQVECGSNFIAALTTSQTVLLWGLIWSSSEPKQAYVISTTPIDSVACGFYHVAMLSTAGDVFTCGYGSDGQLGRRWCAGEGFLVARPVDLGGSCDQVECGSESTLFLLDDGSMHAAGHSTERAGHLGVQQDEKDSSGRVHFPARVQINQPVTEIAANISDGTSTFGALTESGVVFSWGHDEFPKKVHDETDLISAFYGEATPPHLGDVCRCRDCMEQLLSLY